MKALYDEIRNYIFVFQLFALCPFGRNEFQNYILGLYSLLYFVILVALSIIAMFYNKIIYDNNSISAMVAGLVFLGEISTHSIIILQAFVSRYDLSKFLTEIGSIDELFQIKLNRPIDHATLKRKYLFKFSVILFISNGLLLFLLMFLAFGHRKSTFLFWLHVSFSIAVVNMRCTQNIFFVDFLRERLEFLNQRLIEIAQRNSKQSKLILYVEAYDHRNRLTKPSPMHNKEFDEILALKQIYGLIWNASILLNNCFGWSVLAIVTRSFIGFTSHGYWLFLGFESLIDSDIIVDSATNFVLIALLLSVLCLSCYNCTGCVSTNDRVVNFLFKFCNVFSLQRVHKAEKKIAKFKMNKFTT